MKGGFWAHITSQTLIWLEIWRLTQVLPSWKCEYPGLKQFEWKLDLAKSHFNSQYSYTQERLLFWCRARDEHILVWTLTVSPLKNAYTLIKLGIYNQMRSLLPIYWGMAISLKTDVELLPSFKTNTLELGRLRKAMSRYWKCIQKVSSLVFSVL